MEGLYIHIPFCSGKCGYCSFVSFPGRKDWHERYLRALQMEMALFSGRNPETLYIGGGTPSELSVPDLKKLFLDIGRHFRTVREFVESTFEANPESLTRDKIMLLKQFGFNRVSMGLQATQAELLAALGRRHSYEEFLSAYHDLRSVGFNNINVDLIAGVPGQTAGDFSQSLRQLIELGPEHVSVYALEIEPGTDFDCRKVDNRPDFTRTLLETASSELQGAGYAHYEISNYAKPGFECRHNLNYWDNGEYLGLGCSAASHIGGIRKINGPMLDLYCKFIEEDNSSTFSCVEKLEGKEKLGETLMLGLRKLGGMSVTREMQAAFGRDFDELESQGLLLREKDVIRLAAGAVYVSNAVFRRFVPPFD